MRIKKQKLPYIQVYRIAGEFPTFFSVNGTFHWLVSKLEAVDNDPRVPLNVDMFSGLTRYPNKLAETLQTMRLSYGQAHAIIRYVQTTLQQAIRARAQGVLDEMRAKKIITVLFASGREFYANLLEKEYQKNTHVNYNFGKTQTVMDDAAYLGMVRNDLPPGEQAPAYSHIVRAGKPYLEYAPNGHGDYSHVLFPDMKNGQVEFGWSGKLSTNIIYATLAANIKRAKPTGNHFDISLSNPDDEFVMGMLGALLSLSHNEPQDRLAMVGNLYINGHMLDWRTLCKRTSNGMADYYTDFKRELCA
jgi:hypothetical protein